MVVNKPCGLATMGAASGKPSVHQLAAQYVKRKYGKPGKVYLGIVSRLDAAASGVLVLARTSKAASRISEQIRLRTTFKEYLAVVEGSIETSVRSTQLTHQVVKDDIRHRMQASSQSAAPGQVAVLEYRSLLSGEDWSILIVQLITGRKHQIRVQLSAIGSPILGDAKYGSSRSWPKGIALHCLNYCMQHPTRKTEMSFTALPEHWKRPLGGQRYQRLMDTISTRSKRSGVD